MKVLHVDTSGFFKKILADLHSAAQVTYITADSGKQGLELISEHEDLTLIYTALELSDMNGAEFIREAEKRAPSVPIVVLTATDNMETRKEIFELGVIDYIPKTTPADQLISYIRMLYIDRFRKPDPLLENLKNMSIAVVEPEDHSRNIIQNILRSSEIDHVKYYTSTGELFKDDQSNDMYLIDMTSPGYSPEQTIHEIRKKEGEGAVIIILSSVDHNRTVSHILASGADDYIFKPFDVSVFLATLKSNSRFFKLLTELESRNKELNELAIRDSLTDLYNHAHTYHRLVTEIDKCRRYSRTLSILMADLDHFKQVNDRFGHQAGDRVLTAISRSIQESIRSSDIAGRYGGEEFLVVLPETDLPEAIQTAERIRQKVEKIKYSVSDLKTTITIGVASLSEGGNAKELVQIADRRLYEGKKKGRNIVIHSH